MALAIFQFVATLLLVQPNRARACAIDKMNLALRRMLPSRSVRDKISSALGPTHLISPEGIHVDVPEKDVEAALARGFKWDMETLLKEARSYGKGDKRSPEQAILAKLSDEELDALQSAVS